jgi:hypothetical protein
MADNSVSPTDCNLAYCWVVSTACRSVDLMGNWRAGTRDAHLVVEMACYWAVQRDCFAVACWGSCLVDLMVCHSAARLDRTLVVCLVFQKAVLWAAPTAAKMAVSKGCCLDECLAALWVALKVVTMGWPLVDSMADRWVGLKALHWVVLMDSC